MASLIAEKTTAAFYKLPKKIKSLRASTAKGTLWHEKPLLNIQNACVNQLAMP